MELDVVPANHYLRFRTMFPETEIVDVSPLIRQIRMIKSEYEIGKLQEAAAMSDRLFAEVPGVSGARDQRVFFRGTARRLLPQPRSPRLRSGKKLQSGSVLRSCDVGCEPCRSQFP